MHMAPRVEVPTESWPVNHSFIFMWGATVEILQELTCHLATQAVGAKQLGETPLIQAKPPMLATRLNEELMQVVVEQITAKVDACSNKLGPRYKPITGEVHCVSYIIHAGSVNPQTYKCGPDLLQCQAATP